MDDKKRARLEAAITPQGVSGYSEPRSVRHKPATAPEWAYWPPGRTVEQWQAVSLSLGLDPDSLELRDGGFIAAESFPSADAQNEFTRRMDLIHGLTRNDCAPLAHFVALLGKLSMPAELLALALPIVAPSSSDLQVVSPADRLGGEGDAGSGIQCDWKEKSKAIAQKLGMEKWDRGERQITARGICDAVGAELASDQATHGLQGVRSADNVRVEGLRGWKFVPPQVD